MENYRYGDILRKITHYGLLSPLDVLLVGGTGTGKSTTINAIFGSSVAKVGEGVDPETQMVSSYRLHKYFCIHDSAGLGDGLAADATHAENIAAALRESCWDSQSMGSNGRIDLVLVLLDGGSRDLGTALQMLEKVVLKGIAPDRVVVAINLADMAMKGRHWNSHTCRPEPELLAFLEAQAHSVQRRIRESAGLEISKPVFYSARHRYNLAGLVDHLVDHIPTKRRKLLTR